MISVIVPWRTDNGPRQKLWDWNKARWEHLYKDVEILEADTGSEVFNRGQSRNLAVSSARNDFVAIADADTVPNRAFIDGAMRMVAEGSPWVIPYELGRYYNLNEQTTERYLKLSPTTDVMEPRDGEWDFKLNAACGMIVLRREDFVPYDERFGGWGWEDRAWGINMDRAIGKYDRLRGGYVVHLWHPRGDVDFDTEEELKNREIYDQFYGRGTEWLR